MTRVIMAVALGAWALGWGAADRSAAADGEALEKLLKATKLDYTKVKPTVFKVVLDQKQGVAVIYLEERKLGKDLLYVYICTDVLRTPEDFKPPVAMLAKLNDVNDNIVFGSLALSKNKDGSQTLFRNGTLFLKNLDTEQLLDMVVLTYLSKFAYQKEFRGFLESP